MDKRCVAPLLVGATICAHYNIRAEDEIAEIDRQSSAKSPNKTESIAAKAVKNSCCDFRDESKDKPFEKLSI